MPYDWRPRGLLKRSVYPDGHIGFTRRKCFINEPP